jgi:DNA topoisomerase I
MIRAAHARVPRPAHRDLAADDPKWFTADGQRKWKVPPAGVHVEKNKQRKGTWIERWPAPQPKGHKGEVKFVYNYTLKEVQRRAGIKFAENRQLARQIPDVRKQVIKDLVSGDGKTQQLAMVMTLIDKLYLRVGGDESAAEREHYGATTLEKRHVHVHGDTVKLGFVGKSGKDWDVSLKHPQLAKALKAQLEHVSGAHHRVFDVHPDEVNAYLKPFDATAKKFRTFHATRMAREELLQHKSAPREERQKLVDQMFEHNAERMHHTAAVDRENYVDPMVVKAFMLGRLS